MGLKKRSKVTALFNMSSLTDIIFLLLIFFMLTSSLVAPNALNLKLPGQARKTPPSDRQVDKITIARDCAFRLNGAKHGSSALETQLRQNRRSQRDYTVSIGYQAETPTECVVEVMDMARRLDINGILAAPKAR